MNTSLITLSKAFTILELEAPAAYYRIIRELADIEILLHIDDEEFLVSSDNFKIVFSAPPANANINVRTNKKTIVEIVDGKRTPLQTILSRDLSLYSNPSLLPYLSRACTAFAEGAVRSRPMRKLLEEFRNETVASKKH